MKSAASAYGILAVSLKREREQHMQEMYRVLLKIPVANLLACNVWHVVILLSKSAVFCSATASSWLLKQQSSRWLCVVLQLVMAALQLSAVWRSFASKTIDFTICFAVHTRNHLPTYCTTCVCVVYVPLNALLHILERN